MIGQTGVLTSRRRRAVDSTILADAVATHDTVTQLVSAIRGWPARCLARQGDRGGVHRPSLQQAGQAEIDWDDPAAKDALVSALVNDANTLVAAFAGAELDEPAASALALLALVAGQDVEPAEAPMGGMAGGGSPGGSPKTVISTGIPMPGTPASHRRPAGTVPGACGGQPQTGIITVSSSPGPPGRRTPMLRSPGR